MSRFARQATTTASLAPGAVRALAETSLNSTSAKRNNDIFTFRAAGNGARIRNLRAESSRNQVSLLILGSQTCVFRNPLTPRFRTGRLQRPYEGPPINRSSGVNKPPHGGPRGAPRGGRVTSILQRSLVRFARFLFDPN
jgi:hypothetical protein